MLKLRSLRFVAASAIALIGAAVASAQILNSERIEQTFGSYGIDVLYSDGRLRISNLYSEHGGEKLTRTLAIVEYPEIVDETFAAEHQAIVTGGSIGATFQDAGWQVIKLNLALSESAAPKVFVTSMDIEAGTTLATHFYRLEIERDGQRFPYAEIVEMHHPEYLRLENLASIYPLEPDGTRLDRPSDAVSGEDHRRRQSQLILAALEILEDQGSTLSQ